MSRASTRSQMRPSGQRKDATMASRSLGYGSGLDTSYRLSGVSYQASDNSLPNAELGLGFLGGVNARVPARRPHQVDVDIVHGWEAVGQHRVRLGLDDRSERASRRRQRHIDDDVFRVVVDLDTVHEPEVDDADADLGVVDGLQR